MDKGVTALKRAMGFVLAACIVLSLAGCDGKKQEDTKALEQAKKQLNSSFQTTARVRYKDLETQMVIYKKPMNCAVVTFDSPKSLQDMKLTFYTEKVAVQYKDMNFDFIPDSVPGQAASKLILSALNNAMAEEGVQITQQEQTLVISGQIEEGDFKLTLDRENGNILKLSVPDSQLDIEILNFKILE